MIPKTLGRRGAALLLAAAGALALAGCTAIASAGPDGGAWTPPPATQIDREAQKCNVLTDPPCFGAAVERGAAPEKPPYIDGGVAPDRRSEDIPSGGGSREAQAAVGGWPDPTPDVPAASPIREAAGIDISPCVVVSSEPAKPTAGAGVDLVDPCDNLYGGRQAEAAPADEGAADPVAVDPGPMFPQMSVARAIRPQAVIFADRQAQMYTRYTVPVAVREAAVPDASPAFGPGASGTRSLADCLPNEKGCVVIDTGRNAAEARREPPRDIPSARFAVPEPSKDDPSAPDPGSPSAAGGYLADRAVVAPGIYPFGGGADEADLVVGTVDPAAGVVAAPGDAADHVVVCVFGSGAEEFALGVEWVTEAAPVAPLADGRVPVCFASAEEADASGFVTAVLGWSDGRTVRIEASDAVGGRVPFAVVPLAGGGRPMATILGDAPAAVDVDGRAILVDRRPLAEGGAVVRVEVRSALGIGQCGSCWAFSVAPEGGRRLVGDVPPERSASILSLTLEEAQAWADWVAAGGSLEPAVPLGPGGSPLPVASPDPAASTGPDRSAAALADLPATLCLRAEAGIVVASLPPVKPAIRRLPDGTAGFCWDRGRGAGELRADFSVNGTGHAIVVGPGDGALAVSIHDARGGTLADGPLAAGRPFLAQVPRAISGVLLAGSADRDLAVFTVGA